MKGTEARAGVVACSRRAGVEARWEGFVLSKQRLFCLCVTDCTGHVLPSLTGSMTLTIALL